MIKIASSDGEREGTGGIDAFAVDVGINLRISREGRDGDRRKEKGRCERRR